MSVRPFPVLLVGSARHMSMEHMYRRAFAANDFDQVELLDVDTERPQWLRNRWSHRLLPLATQAWAGRRLAAHLRPVGDRYRWIIVFKGMELTRRALEQCRRLAPSATWINVNPDDPYNLAARGSSNRNVVDSISFFDVYCMWSRALCRRLQADGAKHVVFLPFAYDDTCQSPPSEAPPMREPFIFFFGAWDREREAFLQQLAGYDVIIHGARWERVAADFPFRNSAPRNYAFGTAVAPWVASAAICLNHLRAQNRGSHNLRTFEIPAMGGLLLTPRTEEQQEFFPDGEACYMFGDAHELRATIDRVLANPREADRVRERGIELVKSHSLRHRVRALLDELSA